MTTPEIKSNDIGIPPTQAVAAALWLYRQTARPLACMLFSFILYALLWNVPGKQALWSHCDVHIFTDKRWTQIKRWFVNIPTELIINYPNPRVLVCEGGKILNVVFFYGCATVAGQLTECFRLPGLVGMILISLALHLYSNSHPTYRFGYGPSPEGDTYYFYQDTPNYWTTIYRRLCVVDRKYSASLRHVILAIFVVRTGLSIDLSAIRRHAFAVVRLAIIPCLAEALSAAVMCQRLMKWSWPWATMLGFILAGVSPDVLGPNMRRLEEAGLGVGHGVPTITMAASSIDNLLSIICFGVAYGAAFSQGTVGYAGKKSRIPDLPKQADTMRAVKRWAAVGFFFGLIFWVFPHPGADYVNVMRGFCLIVLPTAIIMASMKINVPLAGVIACLLFILTINIGWQLGLPWCLMRDQDPALQAAAPQQSDSSSRLSANEVSVIRRFEPLWPLRLLRDQDQLLLALPTPESAIDIGVPKNSKGSFCIVLSFAAIITLTVLLKAPLAGALACFLLIVIIAVGWKFGWTCLVEDEVLQSAARHLSDASRSGPLAPGLQRFSSLMQNGDRMLQSASRQMSVVGSRVSSRVRSSSLMQNHGQMLQSAAHHLSSVRNSLAASAETVTTGLRNLGQRLQTAVANRFQSASAGAANRNKMLPPPASAASASASQVNINAEPDNNNADRQSSNSSVAAWAYFMEDSQTNNANDPATGTTSVAREHGMACVKAIRSFLDAVLWLMQPLLFALFAESVPLQNSTFVTFRDKVAKGILVVGCGVVIRLVVTFLALTPSKLTIRERIYVVFAWMPKGTVQALISGLVFNELSKNTNAHLIDWGVTHNGVFDFTYVLSQLMIILAVFSALVTAPIGGLFMWLTARRLLPQEGAPDPRGTQA